MKLTANFNLSEFECNCGCKMPDHVLKNVKLLAGSLQILRIFLNKPIKLTNGYRCESKNNAVNGVKNSQHLKGLAADLQVKGTSPDELADIIDQLMDKGLFKMGGLGRYKTFTHVDIRGKKARW